MRQLARLWFSQDATIFKIEWNHDYPKLAFGVLNAQIYRDTVEYAEFYRRAMAYCAETGNQLIERVTLKYLASDLHNADLLRLTAVGYGSEGGNAYGRVYERHVTCEFCLWETDTQVRRVIVDTAELRAMPDSGRKSKVDFYATAYGEILVSAVARRTIQEIDPSVGFSDVCDKRDPITPLTSLYQLRSARRILSKLPESPVFLDAYCPHLNKYRHVLYRAAPGDLGSEYLFEASESLPGLAFTVEEYGRSPEYHPLVFISQSMLRAFQTNNLRGYWVQPARLTQ